MNDSFNIIHVNNHYEIYINGKFYCTTDTMTEAIKEIEEEYYGKQ